MSKVYRLDSIGRAVDELVRQYKSGSIRGLLIQVLNDDGAFLTCRAGNISYLEMLGLLEAAKDDFRVCRYREEFCLE